MPATAEKLSDLHELLTHDLTIRIRNGEATSQDLNVARQFLRDNKIEASIDHGPMKDLLEGLKTFDDYDNDHAHA